MRLACVKTSTKSRGKKKKKTKFPDIWANPIHAFNIDPIERNYVDDMRAVSSQVGFLDRQFPGLHIGEVAAPRPVLITVCMQEKKSRRSNKIGDSAVESNFVREVGQPCGHAMCYTLGTPLQYIYIYS